MDRLSKRDLLAGFVAASTGVVAGCTGGFETEPKTPSATPSPTPTFTHEATAEGVTVRTRDLTIDGESVVIAGEAYNSTSWQVLHVKLLLPFTREGDYAFTGRSYVGKVSPRSPQPFEVRLAIPDSAPVPTGYGMSIPDVLFE